MGSIGDCYDNALIESLWGTMQLELLDTKNVANPRRACQRYLRMDRMLVQSEKTPFQRRNAQPRHV